MWVLMLVCFAGLVVAHGSNLDSMWNLFKQTHGKVYTGREEATRRAVWKKTIRFIQQHNLEADLGLHTYWVGLNEYSDLMDKEYKNYLTGYRRNSTRKSASQFVAPWSMSTPSEVNWRKEGYVTEVKNQKNCSSSWAFSITGSVEGQHFRKTGHLVSLSEQNLIDCSEQNFGCKGGSVDLAVEDIIKNNNSIDTVESYLYKAWDGSCRRGDVGATVAGVLGISHDDEATLGRVVADFGPVSAAIDASQMSFRHYRSGVYYNPQCSIELINHHVLIVGYGKEGGLDYWLVKNSWGDTWGIGGYIKMERDRDNHCGIATEAMLPLV